MAGSDEDYRLSVVREKLNNEKIKLWLPPYTLEDDKSVGHYPTDLITRYSQELNISPDNVHSILETLRMHALENLAVRNKFQKTGVASLKVKIVGDKSRQSGIPGSIIVETGLHVPCKAFKEMIISKSNLNKVSLKLISKGKVLIENKTLQEQNIKHNSQIMALVISENASQELQAQEQQHAQLQKTREDAELLASSTNASEVNGPYLQVADQNGRVLKLPPGEQKALALALTFHEKGRAASKRRQYGEALVFLLEADNEFKKCTSEILQCVDNYALLCLDITWCYLQLHSMSHLPDAGERLQICESGFQRSYGQNLERLEILKNGVFKETSLFARLHLLQGILAFYKNKRDEARSLLMKAHHEINSLKVDDEKMSQVMNMGYSASEARLALRQCRGNVEMAISRIIQEREERRQILEKEKEERHMKKKQKKLGKTENGEWVHVQSYQSLLSMGFAKRTALAAIKQANNNISLAIQIIQECPKMLQMPDKSEYFSDDDITEEQIALIVSQGFNTEDAKSALKKARGNVEEAVKMLLCPIEDNLSSSSSSSSISLSSSSNDLRKAEEEQRCKEAVQRLAADIPAATEDHLDITLEEEENILNEYLSLINTMPS